MQIRSEQLNKSHLDTNVFLLFGEEILLIEENLALIRQHAKERGFDDKVRFDVDIHFDLSILYEEWYTQSLFSNKRLIECHISGAVSGEMIPLIDTVPDDITLIVICDLLSKAQKNSKWFKAIDKRGLIISHYLLTNMQILNWMQHKIKQLELRVDKQFLQTILFYNEGNLLAVFQELQKLKLAYPDAKVDTDTYSKQIEQQSQYKPYGLIYAAFRGDSQKVIKIGQILKKNGTEPLYIINILIQEFKLLVRLAINAKRANVAYALKAERLWYQKEVMVKSVLARYNDRTLQNMLLILGRLERNAKGQGMLNVWHALMALLVNISGEKLWIP